MRSATARQRTTRDENINLRLTAREKTLIDSAAEALGRSRSDFVLNAACRAAESALLDRRLFTLSEKQYDEFVALLDAPPVQNGRLERLFRTEAAWEK